MPRAILLALLVASGPGAVMSAEVSGRVAMPEACATAVSPAVAVLEPAGASGTPAAEGPASLSLVVSQRGLQFEPRVSTIRRGAPLKFTNGDTETHNVHVLSEGRAFNESVAPGRQITYAPDRAGILRVVCDVHSHMRAFVVVSDSPWAATCDREGRFRFREVPDGEYSLKVWHELGEGLKEERKVEVRDGKAVDLGSIAVASVVASSKLTTQIAARPWAEVIDRIGVLLSSSLKTASRPGGLPKARRMAQDAYFEEFENSGMETAVRQALGLDRSSAIEEKFKDFFGPEIRAIAANPQAAGSKGVALSRSLLLALSQAGADLDKLGVVDAAHLGASSHATMAAAGVGKAERRKQLDALEAAFAGVSTLADRGEADDAASAMGGAYFDAFHPIERDLQVLRPGAVIPLEGRFNAIRGRVGQGFKGQPLATELDALHASVAEETRLADAEAGGGFGAAYFSSLGIILREGVEVILLLGMLFALVGRIGQPKALRAVRRGVILAVVASVVTAVGLNMLLASAQGRTRELMEGLVMLAAAGVLFYVSYWLISQSESRRWMDFLKKHARQGAEAGGFWTLGLTAFLAVYREGAEAALMYQAQVVIFGVTRSGLFGLVAGLLTGVALLAVLYRVLRTASVKLPMQSFFKATGVMLFAMAVVFAGKAVGELQVSGHLRNTPLSALGRGLPELGFYPNVQAVSIQGLLLAGALLALAMFALGGDRPAPSPSSSSRPKPTAGVGA